MSLVRLSALLSEELQLRGDWELVDIGDLAILFTELVPVYSYEIFGPEPLCPSPSWWYSYGKETEWGAGLAARWSSPEWGCRPGLFHSTLLC